MDWTYCLNPNIKGISAYRDGCRCDRCVTEMRDTSRYYNKVHSNRRAEYRLKNRDKINQSIKTCKIRLKIDTLQAYGGIICKCCKEENIKFLTLDHIYNDGFLSRLLINGKRVYTEDYQKLKKQGFPNKDRYQVLCMNCNFGKQINGGKCPHEDIIKN